MTMRSRSIGPQQNRPSVVVLSDADTERVRRFVVRCGYLYAGIAERL